MPHPVKDRLFSKAKRSEKVLLAPIGGVAAAASNQPQEAEHSDDEDVIVYSKSTAFVAAIELMNEDSD